MRAEKRAPWVDIQFLIYSARKKASDGTGSKGQMSALSRVTFEKYLADARKQVHVALNRQALFWRALQETVVDVTEMQKLATEMNVAIASAEHAFSELLALNSQSLVVLRLYADFTMYVQNNPEKAGILVAEAERIEDQQTKDHQSESGTVVRIMDISNLDVMADNTAVVTIGGTAANLGMILNTNG
jgi:hypothetical protein